MRVLLTFRFVKAMLNGSMMVSNFYNFLNSKVEIQAWPFVSKHFGNGAICNKQYYYLMNNCWLTYGISKQ